MGVCVALSAAAGPPPTASVTTVSAFASAAVAAAFSSTTSASLTTSITTTAVSTLPPCVLRLACTDSSRTALPFDVIPTARQSVGWSASASLFG